MWSAFSIANILKLGVRMQFHLLKPTYNGKCVPLKVKTKFDIHKGNKL